MRIALSMDRLRIILLVTVASAVAAGALGACQNSPERIEEIVRSMEPQAIDAAKERGKQDLNCPTVATTVLGREHGDMTEQTSLQRVVYRIETRGCGRKTTLAVACVPKSTCSALAEGGMVEPDQ
jgi:hypothetical protein